MGGTEVAKENGTWTVSNAFAAKLSLLIHYIYEFFKGNSITKTGDMVEGDVIQIGDSSVYCLGDYNFSGSSLSGAGGGSVKLLGDFYNKSKTLLDILPDGKYLITVYTISGDKYIYSLDCNYNYYLRITFPDGTYFGSASGDEGLYLFNGQSSGKYCVAPVIVNVDGLDYLTISKYSKKYSGIQVPDFDTGNKYYIPLSDIADVQIESETIDVYHQRGALDEETVANAWKAYGDARIAREEAVTISDTAVSDALANDTISDLTQSEVLTDTGLIEGVDTVDTPILDDYQVSTDLDGMKVELKDIFPFCVPFDVFDIVKNLQAGREAPSFSYQFKFDKIGLDYTFNIDLSDFDTVATILRTMELIAFCVGLALITRQIIRS